MLQRFETMPDRGSTLFTDDVPIWRDGPGNILRLWQEWAEGKW
jgi:hypothetical protein